MCGICLIYIFGEWIHWIGRNAVGVRKLVILQCYGIVFRTDIYVGILNIFPWDIFIKNIVELIFEISLIISFFLNYISFHFTIDRRLNILWLKFYAIRSFLFISLIKVFIRSSPQSMTILFHFSLKFSMFWTSLAFFFKFFFDFYYYYY